ncbi:MAG: hypothetical protein V3U84_02125 [Thiotrichaceae bacterium]
MPKKVNHDEERRKLIITAVNYIASHGVSAFTLRSLSAQHNVTKGCLQHYYARKEQVILDVLDYIEASFLELIETDITDARDRACHQLHQMLPIDAKRQGLWRVKLGLLALETEIINVPLAAWYKRQLKEGIRLLKKANQPDPALSYRTLLAVVYGCGVSVNILGPKHLTPSAQHKILDNVISDVF